MPWAGSVDTLAELKAIPPDLRQDGFPILVRTEADWFCFSSSSLHLVDDVNVLAPNEGAGRWLRTGLFAQRRRIKSSLIIYVSPLGSDANTGLTAGSALATIQTAIDRAVNLDIYPYTVTIQLLDGNYNQTFDLKQVNGNVIIRGNLLNPQAVVISASASSSVVVADSVNGYTLEALRINALVSGSLITAVDSHLKLKNVVLGTCLDQQAILADSSKISIENLMIANSPNAGSLIKLRKYSQLNVQGTISALTNLILDTVLHCELFSLADLRQVTFNSGTYTVTGRKFRVTTNSLIIGREPFGSIAGVEDASTNGKFILVS